MAPNKAASPSLGTLGSSTSLNVTSPHRLFPPVEPDEDAHTRHDDADSRDDQTDHAVAAVDIVVGISGKRDDLIHDLLSDWALRTIQLYCGTDIRVEQKILAIIVAGP